MTHTNEPPGFPGRFTTQVAAIAWPAVGRLHFAASLEGGLRCFVNAGQWQSELPVGVGWYAPELPQPVLRLASEHYMTAAGDAEPSVPYLGVVAGEGPTMAAAVSFWPWASESRSGVAQIRIQDPDGALDAAAVGALRNRPVRIRQVVQGGAMAEADAIGRYVLDRIVIDGDGTKHLVLRDAHDDLDQPLSRAPFLPIQGESIAWAGQPVIVGLVRSAPTVGVNSDGSQQWLCDAPVASVGHVRDRGALLAADTGYVLEADGRQLALMSPPVGPVITDASTLADLAPASLRQALGAVFERIGKGAWSGADAEAIDAATGYAGGGYWGSSDDTVRGALAALLAGYGADWWQDGEGVIRLARLLDPAEVDELDLAFDLAAGDWDGDLQVVPDLAPNLSRRMAYQPNALVLAPGDLVTDLDQVPSNLRHQLSSAYRGVAYAGGPLADRYAHADGAAEAPSRFDLAADAQAEINRVVALYAVPRNFYIGRLRGRLDLRFRPGQVGRIRYGRYGLEAGRPVLVTSVLSNAMTGEHVLRFWGA